jgi:dipeptidyl aminopeptidase/acylaminoacyl peptidase
MSKTVCLLAAVIISSTVFAQGTLKEYQRAEQLNGEMAHGVYNNPERVQWINGKHQFIYSILGPEGNRYVLFSINGNTRKDAFDHSRLAASLSKITGKAISGRELDLSNLNITEGGQLEFTAFGKNWVCRTDNYQLEEVVRPANRWGDEYDDKAEGKLRKSPDGNWLAYIKNYNVYLRSTIKDSREYQLSFDGSEGDYYSAAISWSPDSKKIATNKIRPNVTHTVYLIESSPADQLQPKLHSRNYLKPGDALPQKQPALFWVDTKKQVLANLSLIPAQYNLTSPRWHQDSRSFTFEYNQRGHQEYKVMEMDATSGQVSTLIKETSKTFINYSGRNYRYDVTDGKEIIWASERDGWNHLYLYDDKGKLKNQITKGNWVMRRVIQVDEKSARYYLKAVVAILIRTHILFNTILLILMVQD